jgi:hypothetical protein
VTGKLPELLLEDPPLSAELSSSEPELQLVTASAAASRATPRRAALRRAGVGLGGSWWIGGVGQAAAESAAR